MTAGRKISAIKIKMLRYAEPLSEAPTKVGLATPFKSAAKVENVHQDTFQYEESEPTVNRYKNQLTGQVYRTDVEGGEVSISFVIGEYDMATKAAMQGGTEGESGASWSRGKAEPVYKCIYAVTEDDVCIVFPKASIIGTGSSQDNAIGLSMKAVPEEVSATIASEYWFDAKDLSLT